METYINKYSWKCLLGKQSKNIKEENGIYFWEVGKKKHFCTDRILTQEDLSKVKDHSFHYMTKENINILGKVTKTKNTSVIIDLDKFTISGNKNSGLRHSINLAKKSDLIIQDHFDNIVDVKVMLNEWSEALAEKYFRDFSGKNEYFYSNNFHKDCINLFIYNKDKKLLSFATASVGDNCSYIIGKALCNKVYGLSEYTDYLLYQKLIDSKVKSINLGQASKGLLFYKMKFPGARQIVHYDGKVI